MPLPSSFNNLGKPVSYERAENGKAHMRDMYPSWPESKISEIVKAASKLIEQDKPDAIWGHVNAPAPLDDMDWVSRLRLGAALLAG